MGRRGRGSRERSKAEVLWASSYMPGLFNSYPEPHIPVLENSPRKVYEVLGETQFPYAEAGHVCLHASGQHKG